MAWRSGFAERHQGIACEYSGGRQARVWQWLSTLRTLAPFVGAIADDGASGQPSPGTGVPENTYKVMSNKGLLVAAPEADCRTNARNHRRAAGDTSLAEWWRGQPGICRWVLLALVFVVPGTVQAADPAQPHALATAWSPVTLASVELQDQQGRRVRIAEELARPGPVFLNFIFTSCGAVCPVMTAIFSRLDKQLQQRGQDARLYSVSIDPLEDTPLRLQSYAAEHRASPRWRFLTGKLEASEQVQRAFGAWTADRMNHPVATFFRPAPDAEWVRLDGFVSAEELLARL